MSETPKTIPEPSACKTDTCGSKPPEKLPCHVGVSKERDGRFRAWVYFAGRAFAVLDPTFDGALVLDKAYRFRDSLSESGANVSQLIAIPDELVEGRLR